MHADGHPDHKQTIHHHQFPFFGTYDQPFFLARRFASLDIISDGRAAWNLVTTGNKAAAQSFGFDLTYMRGKKSRFANVVA